MSGLVVVCRSSNRRQATARLPAGIPVRLSGRPRAQGSPLTRLRRPLGRRIAGCGLLVQARTPCSGGEGATGRRATRTPARALVSATRPPAGVRAGPGCAASSAGLATSCTDGCRSFRRPVDVLAVPSTRPVGRMPWQAPAAGRPPPSPLPHRCPTTQSTAERRRWRDRKEAISVGSCRGRSRRRRRRCLHDRGSGRP